MAPPAYAPPPPPAYAPPPPPPAYAPPPPAYAPPPPPAYEVPAPAYSSYKRSADYKPTQPEYNQPQNSAYGNNPGYLNTGYSASESYAPPAGPVAYKPANPGYKRNVAFDLASSASNAYQYALPPMPYGDSYGAPVPAYSLSVAPPAPPAYAPPPPPPAYAPPPPAYAPPPPPAYDAPAPQYAVLYTPVRYATAYVPSNVLATASGYGAVPSAAYASASEQKSSVLRSPVECEQPAKTCPVCVDMA